MEDLFGKFTNLGSNVSSTEYSISTWIAKAWTAIDKLSVKCKSDQSDEIKHSFLFPSNCRINCTRKIGAVLNKSWSQYPSKQQLYGHLLSLSKIIEIRRATHVGNCKKQGQAMYTCGSFNTDGQMTSDQLEPIYNSSVQTQDVSWKSCRGWWTIGTSGGRGSRKSKLADHLDNVEIYRKCCIFFWLF